MEDLPNTFRELEQADPENQDHPDTAYSKAKYTRDAALLLLMVRSLPDIEADPKYAGLITPSDISSATALYRMLSDSKRSEYKKYAIRMMDPENRDSVLQYPATFKAWMARFRAGPYGRTTDMDYSPPAEGREETSHREELGRENPVENDRQEPRHQGHDKGKNIIREEGESSRRPPYFRAPTAETPQTRNGNGHGPDSRFDSEIPPISHRNGNGQGGRLESEHNEREGEYGRRAQAEKEYRRQPEADYGAYPAYRGLPVDRYPPHEVNRHAYNQPPPFTGYYGYPPQGPAATPPRPWSSQDARVQHEPPFRAPLQNGGARNGNGPAMSDTPGGGRPVRLRPSDIMIFDPEKHAVTFFVRRIRQITDLEGEAPVLRTLPMCLEGRALEWHNGLSEDTLRLMNRSIAAWETELFQEFRPNRTDAAKQAYKLEFSFDKAETMSLSQYFTKKTNLMHDAEITDEQMRVRYLWEGLDDQLALATPVREDGDTVDSFTRRAKQNEPAARRVWDRNQKEKRSRKAEYAGVGYRGNGNGNPFPRPRNEPMRPRNDGPRNDGFQRIEKTREVNQPNKAEKEVVTNEKRTFKSFDYSKPPKTPCPHCKGDHWGKFCPNRTTTYAMTGNLDECQEQEFLGGESDSEGSNYELDKPGNDPQDH
ncbi:MAG: hypothetical protein M4579_007115 [Chaenotheca gracillima]|nr:MAG: hypothetical protein M4579_007115 [Chaenotheca gracillima]